MYLFMFNFIHILYPYFGRSKVYTLDYMHKKSVKILFFLSIGKIHFVKVFFFILYYLQILKNNCKFKMPTRIIVVANIETTFKTYLLIIPIFFFFILFWLRKSNFSHTYNINIILCVLLSFFRREF